MGTILVVDDDEHIREFVRRNCSALATVVEAADETQAIDAARWSHPDVIVMDLEMPVMDGFEAARLIRADPSLGAPVLVALTGFESDNAVPRARRAGFSYFVRKETNARAFVAEITRLLAETSAAVPPVSPQPLATQAKAVGRQACGQATGKKPNPRSRPRRATARR